MWLAGGIALLGPGGAFVDARAFSGRQARRLFVRLAAIHQPIPQEDVADDLWGPDWPPAWQVAIRALVSKLRGTLAQVGAPGALMTRDGSYELRLPADTWLDLDAATQAIHGAEAALASGQLSAACGWGLAARAISSRPLLVGEEGEWLDELRLRLADVRIRALECIADTWLAVGDPASAARDAAEAIAVDPFRESAHRLLIRAHLAAGEHGAAIRAYRECEQQLRDELGVTPSPETAALVEALVGGPGRGG